MLKVYGADICLDCRNYKALRKARGFGDEYIDITESTANLREFLAIRDTSPVFAPVKEHGGIGIPLFVREDGAATLELDEALAWIGQPPAQEEELPEKRPDFPAENADSPACGINGCK